MNKKITLLSFTIAMILVLGACSSKTETQDKVAVQSESISASTSSVSTSPANNEQLVGKQNANENVKEVKEPRKDGAKPIGNGMGYLPKNPKILEYEFVINSKRSLLYRDIFLFTEDGFAQKKWEREQYDKDKNGKSVFDITTHVYYEDDTGYYYVEGINDNSDPELNIIPQIRNNKKRLIIEYPIKEGNEVIHNDGDSEDKYVVEEYPSSIEGALFMGESINDIAKISYYNDGKKINEKYYVKGIGEYKFIMMDFPEQPTTLQSIKGVGSKSKEDIKEELEKIFTKSEEE